MRGVSRAFSRTSGTVDVGLDDTSIMRASGPPTGRLPQRSFGGGLVRPAAYIIDVASVDDASARRRLTSLPAAVATTTPASRRR